MKSNYMRSFNEQAVGTQSCLNREKDRLLLKEPQHLKLDDLTTNQTSFKDSKGTGLIGSDQYHTLAQNKRCKTKERDDTAFTQMATSAYKHEFLGVFGMLPEPNVRPARPFEPGFGRVKGETESNFQFNATS